MVEAGGHSADSKRSGEYGYGRGIVGVLLLSLVTGPAYRFAVLLDAPATARPTISLLAILMMHLRFPRSGGEDVSINSVQLSLRHRRLELGDFRGLACLAVEGQDVAFGRDGDVIAVVNLAGQDHLGERILQIALDHPL